MDQLKLKATNWDRKCYLKNLPLLGLYIFMVWPARGLTNIKSKNLEIVSSVFFKSFKSLHSLCGCLNTIWKIYKQSHEKEKPYQCKEYFVIDGGWIFVLCTSYISRMVSIRFTE